MAKIKGIEGMHLHELQNEIQDGGRFVHYIWCISIVFMTFKRSSDIYYIRPGTSSFFKGFPFTLVTVFLGWWGIPWGPIYSIETIFKNTFGGIVVTDEVMQLITAPQGQPEQQVL